MLPDSTDEPLRRHIVVFGGTGFLGSRIVAALLDAGHRVVVASRHPERGCSPGVAEDVCQAVSADIRDERSVSAAVDGADGVVNAVSLYVERGGTSFAAIHVDGARRLASRAAEAGAGRLVHLSGIGADPRSRSRYIRCRGQGEAAVREAFPDATIFRPSVMFGPDDAFLTTLVWLVRRLPVVPLFGRGQTRLQPVFVDDVAAAAVRVLTSDRVPGGVYELGGPCIYRYRELLEVIGERVGRRRPLLPVPYAVWDLLAASAGLLPSPPLTRDQIELMRRDNVASAEAGGLPELGVAPTALEDVLGALPEAGRPSVADKPSAKPGRRSGR